jgi:hypothetical protein
MIKKIYSSREVENCSMRGVIKIHPIEPIPESMMNTISIIAPEVSSFIGT